MIITLAAFGGTWEFFATAGDKVFIVETRSPPSDRRDDSIKHLIQEARWVFGDRRIVLFTFDDEWFELIHDGAGNLKAIEPYDGPIPSMEEYEHE